MNIRIEYCVQWNYEPRALSLREEIGQAFPDVPQLKLAGVTLKESGAFEVFINSDLIFSKLQKDRFPNDGEIVNSIKDFKEMPIWYEI